MQHSKDVNVMFGRSTSRFAFALVVPLLAGLQMIAFAPAVQAQNFDEALALAYQNNPSLQATRASLRAADEEVPEAKSGWRPTVSSSLSVGYLDADFENNTTGAESSGSSYPKEFSLTISQPIYRGGRTEAAIRKAEHDVQSSRATMFIAEQTALLNAATVYMDVLRDEFVLKLRINNVKRLEKQLEATEDRFGVGEVTRTDVAQAASRVARANADRTQAEGILISSRVVFERVVGIVPEKLSQPGTPLGLPSSRDEAVEIAVQNNFALVRSKFAEQSSIEDIDLLSGQLLPTVNFTSTASKAYDTSGGDNEGSSVSLSFVVSVPIYQAGALSARIRQSKEVANQARINVEISRRNAVDQAARNYENWRTGLARIVSLKAEVESARIALDGVEQEATVGARTVLDVLDAEQELLTAQVSLVGAERNALLSAYQLLSALGRMTATNLELPVQAYDYDEHYRQVRDAYWGPATIGKQP